MSTNNQRDIYTPLLDKTFETAVSNFILTEFPRLGGPKVIDLLVKELKSIVEQYYPPITNLRIGQMLWFAVAKEEKGEYGKSMKNLRLRPVVLSAVTYDDIQKRAESVLQKEIRKGCIARILREALLHAVIGIHNPERNNNNVERGGYWWWSFIVWMIYVVPSDCVCVG